MYRNWCRGECFTSTPPWLVQSPSLHSRWYLVFFARRHGAGIALDGIDGLKRAWSRGEVGLVSCAAAVMVCLVAMGITVATSYRSVKRYVSAILRGRRGPLSVHSRRSRPERSESGPKGKGPALTRRPLSVHRSGTTPIDRQTLARPHDNLTARAPKAMVGVPKRVKADPYHRVDLRKANRVTDSANDQTYIAALTKLQAASVVPRSGAGAARSLLCSPESAISVGTVGALPKCRAEPPELNEDLRLQRMEPVRDAWKARAALFAGSYRPPGCLLGCKCEACAPDRRRRYAIARVESLKKRMRPRLLACGVEKIPIACRCRRDFALVRCRQWWLCASCQVARAAERQPRIREGLLAAHASAVHAWGRDGARGMRPSMVLVTITARHSGDLATDRKHLTEGWRAFYKSMHAEWGKFPYVGFWEITAGRCKSCSGYTERKANSKRKICQCSDPKPEGHLHCHIVAVWQFRDYERVKSMWRAATKDASYINIAGKRRDGKPTSASSAARYL